MTKETERQKLEREAADAMKANGRIPETAVLAVLPDEHLSAIVGYHTPSAYVA